MSKNDQNLPVIATFPKKVAPDFCKAFVYPKNQKPGMIRGDRHDVLMYIRDNISIALVHYVSPEYKFKDYEIRGISTVFTYRISMPMFVKSRPFVANHENNNNYNPRRYTIEIFDNSPIKHRQLVDYLSLRRMPRSWIKELDPYIDPHLKY